ncbi:hypothetical protein AB4Y84_03465 [Stenotrophomonas sp. 2YAF22]
MGGSQQAAGVAGTRADAAGLVRRLEGQ